MDRKSKNRLEAGVTNWFTGFRAGLSKQMDSNLYRTKLRNGFRVLSLWFRFGLGFRAPGIWDLSAFLEAEYNLASFSIGFHLIKLP